MSRTMKPAALLLLVLILLVGAIVAYRTVLRGRTEGTALLTPVPGASGFEPKEWPSNPVLRNRTPGSLDVEFTYKVSDVPYRYTLALNFAAGAEKGRAVVTANRDGRKASTDSEAVRRWDVPRKAYAVALADRFMMSPSVPSLCLKVVIGPDLQRYDLSEGTLCVAQRDANGVCHPETLACALLRP